MEPATARRPAPPARAIAAARRPAGVRRWNLQRHGDLLYCAGDCGACAAQWTDRLRERSQRTCASTSPTRMARATALTAGEAPAWSADGRKIAFHRSGGVHVIDANGANEPIPPSGMEPTWSPDGTKIAFQTDRLGRGVRHERRWVESPPADQPRVRFTGLGRLLRLLSGMVAGWTDDRVRPRELRGRVGDLHHQCRRQRQPEPSPDRLVEGQPAWSPNGSRIAFDTVGPRPTRSQKLGWA